MEDIKIPDLRFEQTFTRALMKNATVAAEAKQAKIKKARASAIETESTEIPAEEAPLPVITPYIVIQTVVKDQFIMPLVQGFGTALGLFILKPWLIAFAIHGRQVGINLINSVKATTKLIINPLGRRGVI